MFEHEVLSDPAVEADIESRFDALEVDVDACPLWMDLPGVEGLPVLAFYDQEGRHLLTRSGYRSATEFRTLIGAIHGALSRGELVPFQDHAPPVLLDEKARLDSEAAAAELRRLEHESFILVNSNDGGFGTPSRHPHPGMLLELQRWEGRSERADRWIELTLESALRGTSPRQVGEPLPDLQYSGDELARLSKGGPGIGPDWREAADALPTQDPYLGLQDPVDGGVFRYAAGPGWYHPHFERSAWDNLSWALLLRRRGDPRGADRIGSFVVDTFGLTNGEGPTPLRTHQRSNPFHARLTAAERNGIPHPEVGALVTLLVQARAARFDPARCALLDVVDVTRWPRAHWDASREQIDGPDATVDAVGELLIALSSCPGRKHRARARRLADLVLERWRTTGFVVDARLSRLAAGVCAAKPARCPTVLAAVAGQDVDPRFPPPFAELAAIR